jgi:hypothetical protein
VLGLPCRLEERKEDCLHLLGLPPCILYGRWFFACELVGVGVGSERTGEGLDGQQEPPRMLEHLPEADVAIPAFPRG